MKSVMDFLLKVYNRFFLRDLLSYFSPGFIVITSLYLLCNNSDFINELPSYDLNFWTGLLLFLLSFIVGLGINGFGKFAKWIREGYKSLNDKECPFHDNMVKIYNKYDKSQIIEQRERYVILKQMAANNGIALSVGTIIIIFNCIVINCILPKCRDIIIFIFALLIVLIVIIGLFKNAKETLRNQKNYESVIIKGIGTD